MIELDSDNLKEILDSHEDVVVQYGAGWCGNCRMIKPKVKKLAAQHEGITFVYADAEKFPGTRSFAEVSNLPTFAAFHAGKLVQQEQGNKIEIVEGLVNALTNR